MTKKFPTPAELVNELLKSVPAAELAERLGCSRQHVYLIASGETADPRSGLYRRLLELAGYEVRRTKRG